MMSFVHCARNLDRKDWKSLKISHCQIGYGFEGREERGELPPNWGVWIRQCPEVTSGDSEALVGSLSLRRR